MAESEFLKDSTVGMFLQSMRSWNRSYETQFSSIWISGLIDTKNSMFFIEMLSSLLLPTYIGKKSIMFKYFIIQFFSLELTKEKLSWSHEIYKELTAALLFFLSCFFFIEIVLIAPPPTLKPKTAARSEWTSASVVWLIITNIYFCKQQYWNSIIESIEIFAGIPVFLFT